MKPYVTPTLTKAAKLSAVTAGANFSGKRGADDLPPADAAPPPVAEPPAE